MKKYEDLNVSITLRGICYYEKLTKKSFVDFAKNISDTVLEFLYAILVSHKENNIKYTFEFAKTHLFSDPNVLNFLQQKIQDEMNFMNQFGNLFESLEKWKRDKLSSSKKEENRPKHIKNDNHVFIYQVIPLLVKDCGLSIEYVLDELPYTDIDLFLNHASEIREAKLEDERMWTFFTMLPHVNTKKAKFKEFSDLIKFPWEDEKNEIKNNEKINNDVEYLKSIGFKPKKQE